VFFTPLDVRFPDVPHGHELHIWGVGIDEHAIRVEYRISPTMERPGGRPAINWRWRGYDDRGNAYGEAGGAYGVSQDGQATDGVLSLTPIPLPGTYTLHIVLEPLVPSEKDRSSYNFEVVVKVPPAP
jgi:hypothetical protein